MLNLVFNGRCQISDGKDLRFLLPFEPDPPKGRTTDSVCSHLSSNCKLTAQVMAGLGLLDYNFIR